MNNNLMLFENQEVEVFEFNGTILFNPYHVGKCLELSDSAVRMNIKNMNSKQVIKLKNSDVNSIDFRTLNNAGENFLTEMGVYKLIFKSRKENAERFQNWVTDEVLPTLRKTGTYSMLSQESIAPQQSTKALEYFEITKLIINDLRLNDVSKVICYKKALENYNLPTSMLPTYVQSKGVLYSITELIKNNKLDITTRNFNKLLIKKGLLEEKVRLSSSTKSGIKKFKSLTTKGLEYGENQISPQNPKETQPLYYDNTFIELYNLIINDEA